ncbi:putative 5'-AMP-activated protein kinase, regulatory beta subunit [Monocercomonoides exilis]|uniref:putative 5'-AMP-activated protein kinase, regulatory beta subunit n=1 Tax=Monocercomonoides exilis TaxID=2049356 RepID=UPI00355A5667|nr:putative 5'-AMP-activated protein kinase, regulatory beta subunit [Monocercomonoides exilis]|eukprot:MONOS_8918.1-p1 / transcript=MONOS_8918.1 / gene=MONOS_8918 / organism=Monocercomonoides_exilis_PA203 / gene_product=unspecified product / transcript_product=unspecified product / location=Mono_scaffold00351:6402-7253(+) / protein_length=195 / sequence_SO=supercontig / SO=protein_coding / is_pseudo=false
MITDIRWFLEPHGLNYSVQLSKEVEKQLEQGFLHQEVGDHALQKVIIDFHPSQESVESLFSKPPHQVEYFIDFKTMKLISCVDKYEARIRRIDANATPSIGSPIIVSFVWPFQGSRVFLRGSFDGWKSSVPLQRRKDDGIWEVTLLLLPGFTYEYKFLVDGKWMHRIDEHATRDKEGNINNLIHVHLPQSVVCSL